MFINKRKINSILKYKRGLTLVELMVVISIFLIITSIAIFNYKNFSSTISLQNLTDDVALSIRKAQSFAIGARGTGLAGDDKDFMKSYGMHFSINENPTGSLSGSSRSFLMYSVDSGGVKKYQDNSDMNSVCGGQDNDCVELFDIMTIDKIDKIEAYNGLSLVLNSSPTASLDVVFTRPDPKAYLCYRLTSNSNENCVQNVSSVKITLSNGQIDPDYRSKTISIQNTGQISIQ